MKSIEKTNLSTNEIDNNKDKTLEANSLAITQHNTKRKQPLLTIFGSEDDGDLSDNNQLLINDHLENNNNDKKLTCSSKILINNKIKHHPSDETENYADENPLNRRWLLLMEPINALHIAVILGAKVNNFI